MWVTAVFINIGRAYLSINTVTKKCNHRKLLFFVENLIGIIYSKNFITFLA